MWGQQEIALLPPPQFVQKQKQKQKQKKREQKKTWEPKKKSI